MAEDDELEIQFLRELREMRDEMSVRFNSVCSQLDRINARLGGITEEYEVLRKVLTTRWSR